MKHLAPRATPAGYSRETPRALLPDAEASEDVIENILDIHASA